MWKEWAAVVAAAALKLWLAGARTLEAIDWAVHDDRWFVQRAADILAGRWLGDYTQMTLIKGPVYPLWIAFAATLRVPLFFAQQLFYALACGAVCWALSPKVRSPLARIAIFVVLLFNPMTFSDENATRAIREGFYPALALLVFALVAGTVVRAGAMRWAIASGIAAALLWATREETTWILPLFVVPLFALRWKRAVISAASALAAFAAIYGAFAIANGMRYGVFEVVEFKEHSFLRAYGSLTRVAQHPQRPRIPVPKETRERIYAVSPAFAELRAYFEGPAGGQWVKASMPQGGGEIGGAWFMWAIRDAVASAGYYARGARAVREYYDRLAREIDTARRDGRLEAQPGRATLLPPLREGDLRGVIRTWLRGLAQLPAFAHFAVTPRFSSGTDLRDYDIAHTRLAPPRKIVLRSHLAGWAVHVDGALDLTIERADGSAVPGARVTRLPSPDLYEHLKARWKAFPPARHARFGIDVPSGDAFLVLSRNGRRIERIAITHEPMVSFDPGVRMSIDVADVETREPQLRAHDAFRMRVLRGIGRAYQWIFPWFFALAVVLFRPRDRTIALLVLSLLAAIAARVLILAMIDVTSFWVFSGSYQSPSYPLMLAAAMLMFTARRPFGRPAPQSPD